MSCPTAEDREMCLTCRLAGLKRCPRLGVPLPLVEGERRRAWPDLSETELRKMLQHMKDQGYFE